MRLIVELIHLLAECDLGGLSADLPLVGPSVRLLIVHHSLLVEFLLLGLLLNLASLKMLILYLVLILLLYQLLRWVMSWHFRNLEFLKLFNLLA